MEAVQLNDIEVQDKRIIDAFMHNAAAFIAALPVQLIPPVKHTFFPGIYIREIRLPEGAKLISRVHNTEHAFQVMQGKILIYDGEHEAVILEAPYTGRTMPGTQRIGIALTKVIWQNIHPTKIKPKSNSEADIKEAVHKIDKKVVVPYKSLNLIQ